MPQKKSIFFPNGNRRGILSALFLISCLFASFQLKYHIENHAAIVYNFIK